MIQCVLVVCVKVWQVSFRGIWTQKISSLSWNEKANFNFSNQECSLPQDDLTLEGHTRFFKSTCKFTCVKYKHRHLCHSKISIGLKLYWLCINNPKFGQIVTTSLHFEIFFFLCEWQGPLVLIMCTFSLIIYFALF